MPATVLHSKSVTIADGTNSSIVRPSDWNSGHSVVLNVSGSELTNAFGNANQVTFGNSADGRVTASFGLTQFDAPVRHFLGFGPPLAQTVIAFQPTATATSAIAYFAPANFPVDMPVKSVGLVFGFSGSSSSLARTNSATLQVGLWSGPQSNIQNLWTSSLAFTHLVSSSSQTFSLSGNGGVYSWSTVSAAMTRDHHLMIPVTTTIPAGTGWVGLQVLGSLSLATMRIGAVSDANSGAAGQGLQLGSTATSAVPNNMGFCTVVAASTAFSASRNFTATFNSTGKGAAPTAWVRNL